ncbi:MAG: DHH family phosphoesterase [Victivallaceae bacterium]|nr:DHH family phosphoesterase [Victivallaceae bacterium]
MKANHDAVRETLRAGIDFLKKGERIVVAAHQRPDGDAIGSACAFAEILRGAGKKAVALLSAERTDKFRPLLEGMLIAETLEEAARHLNGAPDMLAVLDCATPERIELGKMRTIGDFPGCGIFNLDHHKGNRVPGHCNCVYPDAAATSEAVFHLAMEAQWPVNAQAATMLYLGLSTDTGSFRFGNTTPEALRVAAELLQRGADQPRVVDLAFFSKTLHQQQFEAEMIQRHTFEFFDGKFRIAVLPEELFRKYHFDMRDGESLIDLVREVEHVQIAALIYDKNNAVKVSLRSRNAALPLWEMATRHGGGGHAMACGITFEGKTLEETAKLLTQEVGNMFK